MPYYPDKIEKGQFESFTKGKKHEIWPEWARKVTYLHRWVFNEIEYSSESGRYVQTPQETLDKGRGDCEDQSVLLANMLVDAGFGTRILLVEDLENEVNHVTLQVRLHDSTCHEELKEVYEEHYSFYIDNDFAWSEINDEQFFYFADPISSSYIGHKKALDDCMIEDRPSSWSFHRIIEEYRVEATHHQHTSI